MADWSGWTTSSKLRAALAAACGVILLLGRHLIPYPWLEDLAHETGFALLVAVFIWLIFEYFSRTDEESKWRTRIEQITGEVFYGVLRRNLPKELLNEANALILNQVFVRKALNLEYILEDDTYADEQGHQIPYVKVIATLRYIMSNVTDGPQKFYHAVLMPNPLTPALQDKCDVISVACTQGGNRIEHDMADARQRFKAEMEESQEAHIKLGGPVLTLAAKEEVEVETRYVMAKEEEDAENFETLYPADSIRLMIVDRGPTRRRIKAGSHHPVELENLTTAGGPHQYRLTRYLLPHQGVLIWWKKASGTSDVAKS
jgi:hypothetical protein